MSKRERFFTPSVFLVTQQGTRLSDVETLARKLVKPDGSLSSKTIRELNSLTEVHPQAARDLHERIAARQAIIFLGKNVNEQEN